MKQIAIAKGDTVAEYALNYNETMSELSRFRILEEDKREPLTTLIYYETPEEVDRVVDAGKTGPEPDYVVEFEHDQEQTQTVTIELKVSAKTDRHCCECDNYVWGISCPYHDGTVRVMDHACPMFNVVIEGRF